MSLTNEQIRQIAQELSCGMSCFYNQENSDLVFLPDFDDMEGDLLDAWAEEMTRVRKNRKKYLQIQRPPSTESFEFMLDFVESLPDDDNYKSLLNDALKQNRPFREFKATIEQSDAHREKWYRFHDQKMQQWVRGQLQARMSGS